MWAVLLGRISPAKAVPIHKDDTAHRTAIINAGSAMALWTKGLKTAHLFVRQSVQVAHFQFSYGAWIRFPRTNHWAFSLGGVDKFEALSGDSDMSHSGEAIGELVMSGGNGAVCRVLGYARFLQGRLIGWG